MSVYAEVANDDPFYPVVSDEEGVANLVHPGDEIESDDFDLPPVDVTGFIGQESITLPGVDVTGEITLPLQGSFTLPEPDVTGQINGGSVLNSADMRLPRLAVAGYIGTSNIRLPGVDVTGELLNGVIGSSGNIMLPGVSLDGQIVSAGLLTSARVGLYLSASGTILGGSVGSATFNLPRVRVDGEILVGAILHSASFTLPGVSLSGSFYEIASITSGAIEIPLTVSGTIFGPGVGVNAATGAALALNTRTLGLTRYTGFSFNSFAIVNGTVLAAASNGIHQIAGTNDNGTAIAASFTTGHLNFGQKSAVTVRSMFVSYRTTGAMQVSVKVDDASSHVYYLDEARVEGVYRNRVKFGRGMRGKYWQFTVANQSGADFSIDQIEFETQESSRKVA